MTYHEWEQIATVEIAGTWPAAPANPQTIPVWYEHLAHLDADVVLAAVRRHAERSKWPPTVAELLDIANPDQEVRDEYARLPDFTGSMELPEAEWVERREAGIEASRRVLRSATDRDREDRILEEIARGPRPALPEAAR